jgi:hypothetical protein
VSVPTAELTTPAVTAPDGASSSRFPRNLTPGRLYLTLGGAALVVAALTLLVPSTPSYDPWAWIVWGREILHINLHTTGGPSWKPLPVIFTTIFSIFGKAAPDLWLIIARAGAIMAAVMSFKLAWRVTRQLTTGDGERSAWSWIPPLLAGLIAAASLINSRGFITDNAYGYSEGLMTALVLMGLDSHIDGRRRQAFAIGFAAALDRPELWLLWGPYGLYLFWKDPGARKLVIGLFALIPVLWFLPELWGSGHLLRGVTRAQHPRSNSAAFASCPVCTVFRHEAWPTVLFRVKILGIIGMLVAAVGLLRMRGSWSRATWSKPSFAGRLALLVIGIVGYGWWLGIALETQAGFSGNDRYLVLGVALVAISGGIGWGWAASLIGSGLKRLRGAGSTLSPKLAHAGGAAVALVVLLATPPWWGKSIIDIPATHRSLVYQAHLREDVQAAISQAGGAKRLTSCGALMTEGFQVPMVAYYLGVHTLQVQAPPSHSPAPPPWPNVILQTRAQSNATLLPTAGTIVAWEHDGARYTLLAHVRTFRIFSTCPSRVT